MSRTGLSDLLRQVAVSVGSDSLDTLDLILLGVLNGAWTEFEREVARGLALERAHGKTVTKDDVRAEATVFRYQRGLISAADFRQWLEQRGIATAEVSGVLRRLLLRRQFDGPADPGPEPQAVMTVLRAETMCNGILGRLAEMATGLLAAGQLAPDAEDSLSEGPEQVENATHACQRIVALGSHPSEPAELRRRISRLVALELTARELRREVGQPSAVAERIRDHALDWCSSTDGV